MGVYVAGHLLLLPAFLHMNMMRVAVHCGYFNLQMSHRVSTDAALVYFQVRAAVNRPVWPFAPRPIMHRIPSNLCLLSFFVIRAAVATTLRWWTGSCISIKLPAFGWMQNIFLLTRLSCWIIPVKFHMRGIWTFIGRYVYIKKAVLSN